MRLPSLPLTLLDRCRAYWWALAGIVVAVLLLAVAAGILVHVGGPIRSSSSAGGRGTAPLASPVGVRHMAFQRGAGRPLPTTIWYPARGGTGGEPVADAPVGAGRYPLVLFSHGLPSVPQTYAAVAIRLAALGMVVAAPAYPHTNSAVLAPTMADVPNQPADAFTVIEEVLSLNDREGDPLAGHLDPRRYAAVGHSAGGFTTAGMLASAHDARLAAAVIISGGMLGPFRGPGAEVLFIHGDADQTISHATGWEAYRWVPWSKAFLTVLGGDHKRFLTPGQPGFDPVMATLGDFLRGVLCDDQTARDRLAADGSHPGVRFERQIV